MIISLSENHDTNISLEHLGVHYAKRARFRFIRAVPYISRFRVRGMVRLERRPVEGHMPDVPLLITQIATGTLMICR